MVANQIASLSRNCRINTPAVTPSGAPTVGDRSRNTKPGYHPASLFQSHDFTSNVPGAVRLRPNFPLLAAMARTDSSEVRGVSLPRTLLTIGTSSSMCIGWWCSLSTAIAVRSMLLGSTGSAGLRLSLRRGGMTSVGSAEPLVARLRATLRSSARRRYLAASASASEIAAFNFEVSMSHLL